MKTVRMTMAQALVRFLDQQYVEIDGEVIKYVAGVFGIFGHGVVLGLGEALAAEGHGLRFYQGKTEQGAAHAAIGSPSSGAPPDHGRHQLHRPGRPEHGHRGRDGHGQPAARAVPARRFLRLPPAGPVLQQVEQPGDSTITANDAFKSVSRYWDRISRPSSS